MTERLYYTDSYLRSFVARVTERADDGKRIYLDRTAFYPTSGGQPNDTGVIDGVPVADVVDEGERIAHVLAAPLAGELVKGEIDWDRRFDHMQQHSGQHLISALFADRQAMDTLSVHFGVRTSTIDLAAAAIDETQLAAVEDEANDLVARARPISVDFQDAAVVVGLRKASERPGPLRVVSIEGVDRSACGGTHLRSTAEIGPVLLRRQDKVKRAVRIEFVCGRRAVREARTDFAVIAGVARQFSASIEDVPALVESTLAQLKSESAAKRKLAAEVNVYRARERYTTVAPGKDGIFRLVEKDASGSQDDLRSFALAYVEFPRAVFIAASQSPPAIMLAASADSGVDAGRVLKRMMEQFGGRGGGSPRLAQGSLPSTEALHGALLALLDAP